MHEHIKEKGFGLVAELVALVIALLLLLALNSTLETGIEANSLSAQRAYATSLAEGIIEKASITKSLVPVTGSRTVRGVTYSWKLTENTIGVDLLYINKIKWGYVSPNHNLVLRRLVSNAP